MTFKLMFSVAFILSVAFQAMGQFIPENGIIFKIVAYVVFGISFSIVFPMSIYNFCRKVEQNKTFVQMVHTALHKYFAKINLEIHKNLEFFTLEGHFWLELRVLNSHHIYEDHVLDELDDSSSVSNTKGVRLDSISFRENSEYSEGDN